MNPNAPEEYKPESSPESSSAPEVQQTQHAVPVQEQSAETPSYEPTESAAPAPVETEQSAPLQETDTSEPLVAPQPSQMVQAEVPQRSPATVVVPPAQTEASEPTKRSKKKLFLVVLVSVLAVLLLAGAAAFAYFGVYVPGQPENVLKRAAVNSAQETPVTANGKASIAPGNDVDIQSFDVAFVNSSNATTKTSVTDVTLTASGIDFSVEARIIEDDIYVKVGNISTIKSLLTAQLGILASSDEEGYAPLMMAVDEAETLLSEQWIIIDNTLLQEADLQCVTDTNWAFTEEDIAIIETEFEQNPFITINSNSEDTINGAASLKYELTADIKRGEAFGRGLNELSFVKALNACNDATESIDSESDDTPLLKSDTLEFSVWVDTEAERINKVAFSDVAFDDGTKLDVEATVTYEEVNVDTPQNAKPAMQLVAELQTLYAELMQEQFAF